MSIYAKTGMPSKRGPYWITSINDGRPNSIIGRHVFYVCDDTRFNVLGLLFHNFESAEAELKKIRDLAWDGSVNDNYVIGKLRACTA